MDFYSFIFIPFIFIGHLGHFLGSLLEFPCLDTPVVEPFIDLGRCIGVAALLA